MSEFRLNVKLERLRHKASGAAIGLSCAACLEQPAGVFAGCGAVSQSVYPCCGAKYSPREIHLHPGMPSQVCRMGAAIPDEVKLIASGTAIPILRA